MNQESEGKLKAASLIALLLAIAGIGYLIINKSIFSKNIFGQIIQASMAALMIWARITFGIRSFHASANTTKGGLVTSGPYQWFRHPIYTSIIYFVWAGVLSYPSVNNFAAAILVCVGLIARMIIEESFLMKAYGDYKNYSLKTFRLIPFLY